MKNDRSNIFLYGAIIALVLWSLYQVRSTVMPFVLAASFAYLLNPLVSFLTRRLRVPRNLSIVIIYIALIGLLGTALTIIGSNLTNESEQFSREAKTLMRETNNSISALPGWLQPFAIDSSESIRTSLLYPQKRVVAFLPGAVNRTIGVLIFLVASFYFLKDGHNFIKSLFTFLPEKIARETETILSKISGVLGNYLRGQLFLVVIMSTTTYIGLTIIGVRYALILSIFTGFAEIVPFVGPVVAAIVAMTVAFADQVSRFNLVPMVDLVAVTALYFVLRQLEDLFVIPQVMGRLTRLHPLIIMFVVLTGGHLFGLLGYLAAVPVVASLKVVVEHVHKLFDESHQKAL